ncbi:protein-disulfide reductase DsbD [Limnobacter litoralis]|uniref:Thiol:disulfide interchange protein DsbD n=1 Tax=Limnobacter litoralis TaxID=481366 RepID=A0ABQ5YN83_9BURK|nr:protein-disulfide reductase DsbD [Limnobacter litoralis]GLR25587.1 thiol:disulfide interchange protein DsbD [Limnobacter litoralis]
MDRFWIKSIFAVVLAGTAWLAHAEDFLPPDQAFKVEIKPQDASCTTDCLADVSIQVHEGYYLYRERFALQPGNGVEALEFVGLPHGQVKFDKNLNHEIEALRGELSFQLKYSLGKSTNQPAGKLVVQGCADAGLCYPPMPVEIPFRSAGLMDKLFQRDRPSRDVLLDGATVEKSRPQPLPIADSGSAISTDSASQLADQLATESAWVVLLSFFGLGLLLAFTPCTFPMLPIVTSLVLGDAKRASSRWRPVLLALVYVLGMALTYSVLGVVAGLSGESLVVALQTPAVLWSFGALLAALGVAMLAGYSIQIPASLQTWLQNKTGALKGGSFAPVLLMGVLSALLLGPCVAPPLAGALLFIGKSGNALLGGAALFLLALGMGLPMVLVAAGAGSALPKAGQWMNVISVTFGFLLIGVALWTVTPVASTQWMMLAWSVLGFAVASALWVGLPSTISLQAGSAVVARALAMLAAAAAAIYLVGFASQANSLLSPLAGLGASKYGQSGPASSGHAIEFQPIESSAVDAALKASTKPVVLDFYAEWCVSCKEFELFTLTDPRVAAGLEGYARYRVDVTKNSEADKALMKRYSLFGPPALLFFAPGQVDPVHQMIGFEDANKFLKTLGDVKQKL